MLHQLASQNAVHFVEETEAACVVEVRTVWTRLVGLLPHEQELLDQQFADHLEKQWTVRHESVPFLTLVPIDHELKMTHEGLAKAELTIEQIDSEPGVVNFMVTHSDGLELAYQRKSMTKEQVAAIADEKTVEAMFAAQKDYTEIFVNDYKPAPGYLFIGTVQACEQFEYACQTHGHSTAEDSECEWDFYDGDEPEDNEEMQFDMIDKVDGSQSAEEEERDLNPQDSYIVIDEADYDMEPVEEQVDQSAAYNIASVFVTSRLKSLFYGHVRQAKM